MISSRVDSGRVVKAIEDILPESSYSEVCLSVVEEGFGKDRNVLLYSTII